VIAGVVVDADFADTLVVVSVGLGVVASLLVQNEGTTGGQIGVAACHIVLDLTNLAHTGRSYRVISLQHTRHHLRPLRSRGYTWEFIWISISSSYRDLACRVLTNIVWKIALRVIVIGLCQLFVAYFFQILCSSFHPLLITDFLPYGTIAVLIYIHDDLCTLASWL